MQYSLEYIVHRFVQPSKLVQRHGRQRRGSLINGAVHNRMARLREWVWQLSAGLRHMYNADVVWKSLWHQHQGCSTTRICIHAFKRHA